MTAEYEGDIQRIGSRLPDPGAGSREEEDEEALEAELMLLALSTGDTGEATQDVDLSTLTPAEKRALLALWREQMGIERDGLEDGEDAL
jgi:hypothetical protein